MKRCCILAMSLSLLIVMVGFASGASLTVNLIGKYEGTANAVDAQTIIKKTPMIVRIAVQDGELFYGTVSFPNQPTWHDGAPINFNGVFYEGNLHLSGDQMLGAAKFLPTSPPQLSGNFQHPKADSQDKAVTGVFFLKRTSTNPNAP